MYVPKVLTRSIYVNKCQTIKYPDSTSIGRGQYICLALMYTCTLVSRPSV